MPTERLIGISSWQWLYCGCSSSGAEVSLVSAGCGLWAKCQTGLPRFVRFSCHRRWNQLGRTSASETHHAFRLAARSQVWPWRRVHGVPATG